VKDWNDSEVGALCGIFTAVSLAVGVLLGIVATWLTWGLRGVTETRCPTCGHSAKTATEKSMNGGRQA
jgi:hypothetical protein